MVKAMTWKNLVVLVLGGVIVLWTGGCACRGGPSHLTFKHDQAFRLETGEVRISERSLVTWREPFTIHPEDWIIVTYPLDRSLAGDPIELYDSAGSRVSLEHFDRETELVHPISCPHRERSYRLANLEEGEYTMVHRRGSGIGETVWCNSDCLWQEYEGEEALVVRITVEALHQ